MAKVKGRLRTGMGGPTPEPPPTVRTTMAEGLTRPAWAEINLDAARHNTRVLRRQVEPASLCAVVKAHGYGHGALPMARAVVAGGAVGLAVALVEEGVQLVEGKVSAPILLLSEPAPDAVATAVAAGLTPTIYSGHMASLFSQAAKDFGRPVQVHIKVDTGMHRVGAEPSNVAALAQQIEDDPALSLEGIWTHLAVADGSSEVDRDYTLEQLRRFDEVVRAVKATHGGPLVVHAANSAGAIVYPEARYGMVRCGIALYGESPGPRATEVLAAAPKEDALQPVLSLKARVSTVRRLSAGERPSYGRLRPLPADATVATVPIGYADGVPRALFGAGYEVLIGGRRRPLAGMVTMDQIVVDCGDHPVRVDDEVVLLGRQGDEEITAAEWATLLGTISYEVLCGIGPRVPRVVLAAKGATSEVTVAPPSKIKD